MELWDKSSNFCFRTILGFLWSRGQTIWITTCYLSLFQLAYPNTLNSILGVMCEMQLSFSVAGVVSSGICLCVSAAPTWFPPFAPFFYSTVLITPRNRQNSFEGNTNVSDRVVLGYWRWAVFFWWPGWLRWWALTTTTHLILLHEGLLASEKQHDRKSILNSKKASLVRTTGSQTSTCSLVFL